MSPRPLTASQSQVAAATEAVIALAEHAKAGDALLIELVDAVTSRRQIRTGSFWDGDQPLVQLTLQLTDEQVAHLEDVTGRAITTRTAVPR